MVYGGLEILKTIWKQYFTEIWWVKREYYGEFENSKLD